MKIVMFLKTVDLLGANHFTRYKHDERIFPIICIVSATLLRVALTPSPS